MKSQQTKELEQLLVSYTNKIGTYGCKEVKIHDAVYFHIVFNNNYFNSYRTKSIREKTISNSTESLSCIITLRYGSYYCIFRSISIVYNWIKYKDYFYAKILHFRYQNAI